MHVSLKRVTLEAVISPVSLGVNELPLEQELLGEGKVLETGNKRKRKAPKYQTITHTTLSWPGLPPTSHLTHPTPASPHTLPLSSPTGLPSSRPKF